MNDYKKIFIELFGMEENFEPHAVVRNEINDWDSVGHISLVTKLEDTFDVIFETEDILQFNSYEKGIEILKKYGVELKEEG